MFARIKFFNRISVKFSILMTIAIVVMVTTMQFVVVKSVRKQIVKTTYEMADSLVNSRAEVIERWINGYKTSMDVYANADINATGDNSQIVAWLQQHKHLRNKDFDYMFYSGIDGTTIRDTVLEVVPVP